MLTSYDVDEEVLLTTTKRNRRGVTEAIRQLRDSKNGNLCGTVLAVGYKRL